MPKTKSINQQLDQTKPMQKKSEPQDQSQDELIPFEPTKPPLESLSHDELFQLFEDGDISLSELKEAISRQKEALKAKVTKPQKYPRYCVSVKSALNNGCNPIEVLTAVIHDAFEQFGWIVTERTTNELSSYDFHDYEDFIRSIAYCKKYFITSNAAQEERSQMWGDLVFSDSE